MQLKNFFANKYWNLFLGLAFTCYLVIAVVELIQGRETNEKQWRWLMRLFIFAFGSFSQLSYFVKKLKAEKIKDQSHL